MTNAYSDDSLNLPYKRVSVQPVTFISESFFPTCPSCWQEVYEDGERQLDKFKATFQTRPNPAKHDFVGSSVNL
jgi:hypothetical protein